MAHELNMKLIAEGVESAEQENILKVMNCDFIQGFLHGRPAMFSSLVEQVQDQASRPKLTKMVSETRH